MREKQIEKTIERIRQRRDERAYMLGLPPYPPGPVTLLLFVGGGTLIGGAIAGPIGAEAGLLAGICVLTGQLVTSK